NSGAQLKLRLAKEDFGADYSLQCQATSEGDIAYQANPATVDSTWSGQQTVPGGSSSDMPSQLLLLDSPLLRDTDAAPSGISRVYYAGGPKVNGGWPGMTLQRSTDGGATYQPIDTDLDTATWGVCGNVLPDTTRPWGFDVVNGLQVHIAAGTDTF